MTMLEKALPKKVLQAVDRYRATRGIRSRAKALEQMVLEIAPLEELEHPLTIALRNAPKLPQGSVPPHILEELRLAELEPSIPFEEMIARRKAKRDRSS